VRATGRPQARVLQRQAEGLLGVGLQYAEAHGREGAIARTQLQLQRLAHRLPIERDAELHHACRDTRLVREGHTLERLDARRACRLQPHGLPNPADAGVPVGHLLAERGLAVGAVFDAHDDAIRAVKARMRGDVKAELGVAALVFADAHAVDPHGGVVVYRAEAEPDALPAPAVGQAELAAIPCDAFVLRVANAAEFAFPSVGHTDCAGVGAGQRVPFLAKPHIVRVELELPRAIQRLPLSAFEVRARVLGSRKR
jgi:hypothetical protein